MKTTLALLSLLVLPVLTARAEKIDLGAGRALLLNLPDTWTATAMPAAPDGMAAMGHSARYATKNGSNDALLITVLAVPGENFSDPTALKAMAEIAVAQFAGGSVEGKADLREFRIAGMTGYATTFTDANLVGKPTVKDDYKALTSVFAYLGDGVLLTATVFTDEVGGRAYNEAVRILKSIAVTRPKDVI